MYIQVYIFTYATLFYPITIRLVWENISNYSNLENCRRKEFCKHVVHCVPGSDLKFDRVPGLVCVLDKRDSAVTTWVDNIGQLIHTHAYLVIRYVHTYALCIVHNEVYLIVCMYVDMPACTRP